MLFPYSKAYNLIYYRKWGKSCVITSFSITSDLNFICILSIKPPLWNSGHQGLILYLKEVIEHERENGQ